MLSGDDSVAAEDLVGKRVTLRIETAEGERYWLGMVSAFERVGRVPDPAGSEAEMTSYRCEVVPWLWFLTLHKDTRVFQEQSVPEIIEALLGEFEFKRSEEHTSELQSLMRISYAVFCLKKKNDTNEHT